MKNVVLLGFHEKERSNGVYGEPSHGLLVRTALLSLTPKIPFLFFSALVRYSLWTMFFMRVWASWSVFTLMLPSAETSKSILWLCFNPSVKSYSWVFSLKSCIGHLLSKSLNLFHASYNNSFSPA